MELIINRNAKVEYSYTRYAVDEITTEILTDLININKSKKRNSGRKGHNNFRYLKSYKVGAGKYSKSYLNICCGFDIETYTDVKQEKSIMYIWQFSINNNVIIGRTWQELIDFLDLIKDTIQPTKNQRILVFDHNLSYEFGFFRKWLKFDNINENFLKEQRKPLFLTHDNFIVFQDSMAMTNSSLDRLAKDYTNTQKCKGDLDYSIPRNFTSKLDDIEMSYVDNDVLILSEFARYYNDTYLKDGFRPLTITSTLNREVIEECKKWCKNQHIDYDDYLNYLTLLKPSNYLEYQVLMSYVYRGGYVHANELYVNMTFWYSEMAGFDFTSSYPASMLLCYYPCSKWVDVKVNTIDQLNHLCEVNCVIFEIALLNVKSKTDHSIESYSKCVKCINPILDNGRVRECRYMKVWLTELDWQTYQEFYTFEQFKIISCKIAKRGRLFEYLLRPMLKYYVGKDVLKKAGMPYAIEKAKTNTFYGLCSKRVNEITTKYNGFDWIEEQASDLDKQLKNTPLTPYLGIYITAHSRRNLLKSVYKLESKGYHVIYCDTDSIKILNYDDGTKKLIDEYNEGIHNRLIQACERYGINIENVVDLGMFDCEYGGDSGNKVLAFKSLGAKRYLITYEDSKGTHHNQTVAGLPKNYLFNHYEDWKKVYDDFQDDMVVNDCKLTSKYVDDEFTLEVNGVKQYEKSCVALQPCDFSLSLDETWFMLFEEYQKQLDGREVRI